MNCVELNKDSILEYRLSEIQEEHYTEYVLPF